METETNRRQREAREEYNRQAQAYANAQEDWTEEQRWAYRWAAARARYQAENREYAARYAR